MKQAAQVRALVPMALATLCALPSLVWSRLAQAIGGEATAEDVKDDCLRAAMICAGYLEIDLFAFLDKEPFNLTQGDIGENVRRIGATEQSELRGDISRKIKFALDMGVHPARLEDGLRLLREAPVTVTNVEQGHASAAVIRRDHMQIGEAALSARAALHAARQLFMPSSYDKVVAMCEKRLEVLDRKNPNMIRPQNLYYRKPSRGDDEAQPCERKTAKDTPRG